MSNLVYPTGLLGLKFPVVRRTLWQTMLDVSPSDRVATLQLQPYPLYEWELEYEWLDDSIAESVMKTLLGFFNQHQGGFDSFLFTDPVFNAVTNEQIGTGDGLTKDFQTTAVYRNTGGPGRADIIQEFNGTPVYQVSGASASHTLNPAGVVSFLTPPALNAPITWSGSFFYRVRFKNNNLALSEFMHQWWETEQPIILGSVLV